MKKILAGLERISVDDTYEGKPILYLRELLRHLGVGESAAFLAGVFSLGKKPTGNRDPFGLRRAALGIVRILIERSVDVDLKALIACAVSEQPEGKIDAGTLNEELYGFITDRLRRYFLDRDAGLNTETFDAVMVRKPASLRPRAEWRCASSHLAAPRDRNRPRLRPRRRGCG